MEQRLNFITLGVRDLATMRDFYMNTFGWKPEHDADGIVFFKLNGFMFALYPDHELAEDIGVTLNGSGFKRSSLSINYTSEAEVDNAFQTLTGNGAKSVKRPEKVFWGGYRGYIADPEDNYWELAYNPFLALDAKGNVVSHE